VHVPRVQARRLIGGGIQPVLSAEDPAILNAGAGP